MSKCAFCDLPRAHNRRGNLMKTCGSDACRRKADRDRKRKQRGRLPPPAPPPATEGPFVTGFGTFLNPRSAWCYVMASGTSRATTIPQRRAEIDERFEAMEPWESECYTLDDLLDGDAGNCPECFNRVDPTAGGYRCRRCRWTGAAVRSFTFPYCPGCGTTLARPGHTPDVIYSCSCGWAGSEIDFWRGDMAVSRASEMPAA